MFKKIFGGGKHSGGGGGPPVAGGRKQEQLSEASTQRTINAVQQLEEAVDLAIKRRDLIEKKIAAELQRAKDANGANNKRGALAALKKKKLLEQQLATCENQIQRIQEQQMMVEEQRAALHQIKVMQNAANAGKATMQELDIGSVDQVMDDINEQADNMAQINDALSQPLAGAAAIDDDELEAELEELNAQDLDEQLLEPAPVPSARIAQRPQAAPSRPQAQTHQPMPSVPARKAPAKTPEELELEQLEAEMAQ